MAEETTPMLLTAQQAADKLGVSKATVHTKVNAGEWPYTRLLTRGIRFTQAQIEAIVNGGAVEPIQRTPRRRKAS
jgi:excisionase family DNA binding protein